MMNIEVEGRRCKEFGVYAFRSVFFYFATNMRAQRKSAAKKTIRPHLASFDSLLTTAGIPPERFFKTLRKDLAGTADPLRAVNNLHRFLSAGFTTAILNDFQRYPVLQRITLELFSQSQYLADILVRDPELFRWLTATPVLRRTKESMEFRKEALAAMESFSRTDRKLDALRRFRRREILRIGARDVLKEAGVETITRELSALADAVVGAVLELGWQELRLQTGADFANTLTVIGLGKLGGEELNFSSDIDLLFIFESDGEFHAAHQRIRTFHEFYNRLAEFVVRRLTEFSGEGSLYRVDMRLRPEGRSGPLAISIPASLRYYEMRGETWERQMLVKARPVAGSSDTARRWLEALKPFVYPRTFLRNPLEELSDMKTRIEERTDSANVKLGEGGIRDIEFVVQGLQLLKGGEDESLRQRNTLEALQALATAGVLHSKDATSLAKAYRFLRLVEHRLQLLHGMQTHMLPQTEAEKEFLARRLGFPSGRSFLKSLTSHRKNVRAIFEAIIRPRRKMKRRTARQFARAAQFFEKQKAEDYIKLILQMFPGSQAAERRDELVRVVAETRAPDWSLESLALISQATPLRRAFTQAWTNKELLALLARVGARSRATAALLAREPLFFETLVGSPEEVFATAWSWQFLRAYDPEKFRSYNEHKLLIRFIMGQEDIVETMSRISLLAEDLLRETAEATERFHEGVLLAMGKLGGREITAGSDLDLVFLYDSRITEPSDAEKIVKTFLGHARSRMRREMDFRLRPEGHNAPLAVDVNYYREYLRTRASLWERQSLLKARMLFGNPLLGREIRSMIDDALFGAPLPSGWVEEMRSMRERIESERSSPHSAGNLKTGKGGLMDLEFAVQLLQLRFGKSHPAIRSESTHGAVEAMERIGLIPSSQASIVKEHLVVLRTLETIIRLNADSRDFVLPGDKIRMQALAAALGLGTPAALLKTVKTIQAQNRAFFEGILKFCVA
ncbi:MAG: glutamate-ammonia-ligase adenylyltransferase [Bacteroidia bacterium]|nr:MAG: glutamate-ammonia-ligase adenylyltransferase [Bacteroidia bacterium]